MPAPNESPARPPTGFLYLTAGVAACIAGIGLVAGMIHGGTLVRAWVPEEWLRITILVLLVALGTGAYLLSFVLGICFLLEGFEEFFSWTAPGARRLWRGIAEFFEDMRDDPPETRQSSARNDFIDAVDIDRLPPELAETIRPFLRAGARYLRADEIESFLAEATRLLRAREAFATQERAAVDRQTDLELSRARAAYVAGLSPEERAFFATATLRKGSDRI